jgi:hypothetical protein
MLVAIVMAVIFAGCEKEEILPPDPQQDALEESALKGAKVKDKRSFEGVCIPVDPDNFVWYDDMDDWRVTGTTVWSYSDETQSGGKTILYVDAKNPHEENRGIWEMDWEFEIFMPGDEGIYAVAVVTGEGISGKVKGMKAKWTYTLDWEFAKPETFFYAVKGNIDKPQGPIKND